MREMEEEVSGVIRDLSLGLEIDLGEWVDLIVQYRQSHWSDLVANRLAVGDDLDDGALGVERENVAFNQIGVLVRVGPK
jgi:hypothetical protein